MASREKVNAADPLLPPGVTERRGLAFTVPPLQFNPLMEDQRKRLGKEGKKKKRGKKGKK